MSRPEKTSADLPPYSGPTPIPLNRLLRKKLPPAIPRVWPWLDSGESCLLWGGTGTGKSWLAMTLALGVAGGGEALGWRFPNSAKVLYVDGEQSTRDLQDRFAILRHTLGPKHNAKLAGENLLIEARTNTSVDVRFFDLCAPEHASAFVEFLKAAAVGFVVFDNLSTLSDRMEDENAATAFKPMQALFAQLKAANVAAVLVHHAGKAPGARFRGSSNIGTTFERIVALHHNDREAPTVLSARAEIEKYRSKPPPGFSPQVHFALKTEEGASGKSVNATWEMNQDESQLADAWRLFRHGDEFRTVAEFITRFNERHGTRYLPKHFARDFKLRWEHRGIATRADIDRAHEMLRERCQPTTGREAGF